MFLCAGLVSALVSTSTMARASTPRWARSKAYDRSKVDSGVGLPPQLALNLARPHPAWSAFGGGMGRRWPTELPRALRTSRRAVCATRATMAMDLAQAAYLLERLNPSPSPRASDPDQPPLGGIVGRPRTTSRPCPEYRTGPFEEMESRPGGCTVASHL